MRLAIFASMKDTINVKVAMKVSTYMSSNVWKNALNTPLQMMETTNALNVQKVATHALEETQLWIARSAMRGTGRQGTVALQNVQQATLRLKTKNMKRMNAWVRIDLKDN